MWQRLVANGSMFPVSGTAFAVTPGESYAEQHNAQSTYSSKAKHCAAPRHWSLLAVGATSPRRIVDAGGCRRRGLQTDCQSTDNGAVVAACQVCMNLVKCAVALQLCRWCPTGVELVQMPPQPGDDAGAYRGVRSGSSGNCGCWWTIAKMSSPNARRSPLADLPRGHLARVAAREAGPTIAAVKRAADLTTLIIGRPRCLAPRAAATSS